MSVVVEAVGASVPPAKWNVPVTLGEPVPWVTADVCSVPPPSV